MDIDDMVTILTHWGESPKEIYPVRDVYRVITFRGKRCLKEVRHSRDRFLFMLDGMSYVRNRGFTLMPNFFPARDGSMIIPFNESFFSLQEWIDGIEADYQNTDQMSLAAGTLAQFHRASIGFVPGKEYHVKNKLGKWPKNLKEKTEDLIKWLDMAGNVPSPNNFERKFLEFGGWLLDHASTSREKLAESKYQELVEEARDWGTLVHGDTAARNFVISEGRFYLIDFDSMSLDISVTDLWRLLRRTLKRNRWDLGLGEKILTSYHQYFPLESKHLEVLGAFLEFPEIPWRIVREYYDQRPEHSCDQCYLTEKLFEYLNQFKEIDRFIRKFEVLI